MQCNAIKRTKMNIHIRYSPVGHGSQSLNLAAPALNCDKKWKINQNLLHPANLWIFGCFLSIYFESLFILSAVQCSNCVWLCKHYLTRTIFSSLDHYLPAHLLCDFPFFCNSKEQQTLLFRIVYSSF